MHDHRWACLYEQKAYSAKNIPILKRVHKLHTKKNKKIDQILKKIAARFKDTLDEEESMLESDEEAWTNLKSMCVFDTKKSIIALNMAWKDN